MRFSNGDTYSGNFIDGERCGRGIYEYANGDIYDGKFRIIIFIKSLIQIFANKIFFFNFFKIIKTLKFNN